MIRKKNKKNTKKQTSSQPVNQNQVAMNQALNTQTTSLSQLPPPQLISNQVTPDYRNVHSIGNTQDIQYENFGPMAANEALGGSGFGGANW